MGTVYPGIPTLMNRQAMTPPDGSKPVRRSDWRRAILWVSGSSSRARFVAILLAAAGLCSVLGLLRWQGDLARWSFAALCWSMAAVVSLGSQRRSVRPAEPERTDRGH